MWICLVLVLGLTAFLASRHRVRSHSAVDHDYSQPVEPTCVAIRSHHSPAGPRRPTGRRQRTHYAAPRR